MINKHWDLNTYCWEDPGTTYQEYGVDDICNPIDEDRMN